MSRGGAFDELAVRFDSAAGELGARGLQTLTEAAAFVVKDAGLDRLVLTIGGDRRMARFGSVRSRGRVRGGIGYEYTGRSGPAGVAELEYRPGGFWTLLEDGARRHPIGAGRRTAGGRYVAARGRARLVVDGKVRTGPVHHPGTRPKRVITRANVEAERRLPDEVGEAFAELLAKLLEV